MVTNPSSDLLGFDHCVDLFYLLFDYFSTSRWEYIYTHRRRSNLRLLHALGFIYCQSETCADRNYAGTLPYEQIHRDGVGWIYLYSQCILKRIVILKKTIWAGAMTGMVILLISHSVSEVPNFIQLPGVYLRNVLLNPTHYKRISSRLDIVWLICFIPFDCDYCMIFL